MFQRERERLETFNKIEALNFLRAKPHLFIFFPEKWKMDREIIVEAIYLYPYNYKHIPEIFKNDRSIVLQTIALNGYIFYAIPTKFRRDKDICLLAIEKYTFNVRYISERLQLDEEIFFYLVMKNSWSINYMSLALRNNENIVDKALSINRNIFSYISTNLKYNVNFIINVLIEKYNFLLSDLPVLIRNNRDVIKSAIKKNYINFVYAPKYDKDFLYELYTLNPMIKCFLEKTLYQSILDKHNYLILLYHKDKEEKKNIFHTRDIAYYIMEFLF